MRLWDISPPVDAETAVFPGDTPYRQRWIATIGPDSAANVGEITLSTHIGAHADAPLHYDAEGTSIGNVDLMPFLGMCRVIHAIDCGPLVEWAHLAHALDHLPPRVLVRTSEQASVDRWNPDLVAFAPATIERLAERGVVLIGIDTASIDPAGSLTLESHQVIRRLDMRVLENLVLDAVPEGDYELIALPLKLTTADASPVRAVLRELRKFQE
ncbi:arylformamidase [Variovorax sp. RHLX14]|uniref:arylformamidase n=1 Tax=Variovorax sp. RHLX14 TaxID=1259731 RepID=UPI003F48F98A